MNREFIANRKGKIVKIYGSAVDRLGGLNWRYIGKIYFDEKYGEFMFEPSWWLLTVTEKLIRVIDIEINKLKQNKR